MSTHTCVGCARPLNVGVATHGTYRVCGTTHAVLACSSTCALIGAIVALVGAPPTKRTADDAELETAVAKAAAYNTARATDRVRLQLWLRIIDDAIHAIGTSAESNPTTADLRNVVINIGAPIPGGRTSALAELQRLRAALQRILDKINNNETYDMHDVNIAMRNSLARLTEIEGQYYLTKQRALENDSYLRSVPRDLQMAVGQYAVGGRRKPDATFSWRNPIQTSSGGTLDYVGKYIYVRTSTLSTTFQVLTFNGHFVNTIPVPFRAMARIFEPIDVAETGRLCAISRSDSHGFGIIPAVDRNVTLYTIPESLVGRFAVDADAARMVTLVGIDDNRTAQLDIYQLANDRMELIEQHRFPMNFLRANNDIDNFWLPAVWQFIDGQVLCVAAMSGDFERLITIVDLKNGIVERVAFRRQTHDIGITLIGRSHVICTNLDVNLLPTGVLMFPRKTLNGIVTVIPIYTGPPSVDSTPPEFRDAKNFLSNPELRDPFRLYDADIVPRFQTFVHRNRFHCTYEIHTGTHTVDTFLLDDDV